jgi:hypothetical protein
VDIKTDGEKINTPTPIQIEIIRKNIEKDGEN